MNYSEWLVQKCIELGSTDYIYRDARGKEHEICMKMWLREMETTNGQGFDKPSDLG